ncbi:pyrophosphate-energized vacuolar membrane proton pump-like [Aristolochia californica]|uniref:pyrophosphate-energized vacuolar membrane proton pump-like n=1 Tax=Aristolochia californica TaxID=171875 RepID=UPI0035DB9355
MEKILRQKKYVVICENIIRYGSFVQDFIKLILMNVNRRRLPYTMHIYNQMQILHVLADLVTYTILLNAYCLAGSVLRAQDKYEEVKLVGACRLHVIPYSTIIKVSVEATMWQLAREIQEETVSDGVHPNYYTSNAYNPVHDVTSSYRTGAATNVNVRLALGYKFVIISNFAIVVSIFINFSLAAMYGIVMALGMLSIIATGLAIDANGPISDNAGSIAKMIGMSHRIRDRIDALDVAGPTTAAIGQRFDIGSATLVSFALLGTLVSRAEISLVDVLIPKVFIGLIVDAMLPYWFSAMTMKVVGSAALQMGENNGALVAISASNTGSTWDNAKKYIEVGAYEHAQSLGLTGSECLKAAVIGDTIGGPL